jgi:hypothetical protein
VRLFEDAEKLVAFQPLPGAAAQIGRRAEPQRLYGAEDAALPRPPAPRPPARQPLGLRVQIVERMAERIEAKGEAGGADLLVATDPHNAGKRARRAAQAQQTRRRLGQREGLPADRSLDTALPRRDGARRRQGHGDAACEHDDKTPRRRLGGPQEPRDGSMKAAQNRLPAAEPGHGPEKDDDAMQRPVVDLETLPPVHCHLHLGAIWTRLWKKARERGKYS